MENLKYSDTIEKPDDNINFFDVVTEVLQGDTVAPYLFILCLDYVPWTFIDIIKDKGFILKKTRSRRYFVETMADAHYADDQVFFCKYICLSRIPTA